MVPLLHRLMQQLLQQLGCEETPDPQVLPLLCDLFQSEAKSLSRSLLRTHAQCMQRPSFPGPVFPAAPPALALLFRRKSAHCVRGGGDRRVPSDWCGACHGV